MKDINDIMTELKQETSIKLRSNQIEPIAKAIDYLSSKKTQTPKLIILPTAWGKSLLTAFAAKYLDEKILIIQPSRELLSQNYAKYCNMCTWNNEAGVYSASFGRKDINKITYATIGSIKNIGRTFKQLGFKKLLIDEAHLYPREADSMLGKFLEDSEISHVLGITATPIKLQSNTDMSGERFSKLVMLTSRSKKGNFFKDIIHVSQVQEMIDLGFWSKLQYKTSGFDSSQLVYNSSRSDFTEDSVQRAFVSNDIHSQIKRELDLNSDRKHILAFVPSINEAIQFSKEYPSSAAIYSGMHDSERERVIAEFRKGNIRVIFNVRVLSTGFDYTGIDCLILGISTASIALYYQIIGRATRIDDNKEDALIIDLAGNVDRFGKVEDITFEKERIWKMYGTDGKLLSGIPIHEIGTVKKGDTEKTTQQNKLNAGKPLEVMPFGVYKGKIFKDIPKEYREWMLKTFDWHVGNMNLKQAIEGSI